MWSARLPTFRNTSLLISLLRNKINSTTSPYWCLPCFLEDFPQSENSDTSISHHLMTRKNKCITMEISHRKRAPEDHLTRIDTKEYIRPNNIPHMREGMYGARHIAPILETYNFDRAIQFISQIIEIETIVLVEMNKPYLRTNSLGYHLPWNNICMMFRNREENRIPFSHDTILLYSESEDIEGIRRRIGVNNFYWFTSYPSRNGLFRILIGYHSCLSKVIISTTYVGIRSSLKLFSYSKNLFFTRRSRCVIEIDTVFVHEQSIYIFQKVIVEQ